jgi:hypothetical protein
LTELSSEFHLGFIGGCLARQSGLGVCQQYPNQLAKEVSAVTGGTVRVHIARYADGAYMQRLGELASATRLDGVILHMRALVIRKTALIVKHRSGQTMTYALHPFAFGPRRADWTEFEDSDFAHCLRVRRGDSPAGAPDAGAGASSTALEETFNLPTPPGRVFGLTVGQWNRLAGRVFGLEEWAIRDELAAVDRVRQSCDEMGVRLAILAPLPAPNAAWIERFGQRLANRLRDRLAPYPVPLCRLERATAEETRALFLKDGIHMNSAGHAALAGALRDTVVDWVRSPEPPVAGMRSGSLAAPSAPG